MDSIVSDFRYAFRVLFKRPGLTLLAILALALSLGMSTTAFSTLNGLLFKPLPFAKPEQLQQVYVVNRKAEMAESPVPYERFQDLRSSRSFKDLIGYYSGTINISGRGTPHRYDGAFVSTNFLQVLHEEPLLGRTFTENAGQEDGPRELLISHSMWQERFRGDPDVIGSRILANAVEYTIVGVLQEGFKFPAKSEVWMPVDRSRTLGQQSLITHVMVMGRLNQGVSTGEARTELAAYFDSWNEKGFEKKEDMELTCTPFGRVQLNKATHSFLFVLIAAVIFILLVSCANVANLLVGRALSRGREMAIRSAIGATRTRILRQLLTESLLLSILGAIGGLLYAAWAVDLTIKSPMYELPYWISFELDWRVFLFVAGVMLLTALVSGLVPAWQASKIDLNEMLKDTAHTSTSFRLGRLTRMLAVVQIAFSCALLFAAGLISRNIYQMANIEPGYIKEDILTMRMGLFPGDYPSEEDQDQFYHELLERVRGIEGVQDAAVSSWIAMFGNYKEPFLRKEADQDAPDMFYAYSEAVSPEYFNTFSLPVLEGRGISTEDGPGAPRVAVVNQTFASMFYGNESPVGKSVTQYMPKAKGTDTEDGNLRIVGVVPDIRVSDFTKFNEPEPILYIPHTQVNSQFMSLIIHAKEPPEKMIQAIQEEILDLDPNLPVYFTKTMATYIDDQIYPFRVMANFFLSIGLMALFLAAIGVYGMLAFNVSRRRREIGIRMALGANTISIVTQVIRQGLVQVVAGLVIGSGLAYVVGMITRNFLFGINPADPSVYAAVLLILLGVAILSFFLPARRAARLSPMEALRYE